jgi:mono/diheme cytochrome c family protein
VSYQVGNDQYIALVVGWGGSLGLLKGSIGMDNHVPTNLPRVIAFKLNGTYTLPNVPGPPTPTLNPPADTATPEQIADGRARYGRCASCHGYWGRSAGDAPDLRYSVMVYNRELLGKIVSGGQLRSAGMPMFGPELTSQQLDDIRAYLIHQANGQVAREKAEKQQGN